MLLEDFLQFESGGIPDVDGVILGPNSHELTIWREGSASPVATRLESLAAKR